VPTPRKALDVHKLQGTKPQYVEPTSQVPPGRPKFPAGISPAAKRTFKRIVRLLETRRTCTEGDVEIIRLFCVALDRHARALDHILVEGEICEYTRLDSNGQPHQVWKENLWLKVATDAEKLQLAALDRLGLTPLNRGKVKPTELPTKAPAPDETFPTREEVTLPGDEIDLNLIDETVVN
jgi:P27 family predicted phage terminase small subunit